jgi:hypothetical protein
MTPEERITEMARRMSKSKPSVKLERGPAVAAGDMIDGRYTKAGAAKVIGCALKSLDYVFAHHGRPESVRVAGAGGGSGLATYAPADIDAIAAARRAS